MNSKKQRSSKSKPATSAGFFGWKPKERNIYRYWNGEKDVEADPLEIQLAIANSKDDLTREIEVMGLTHPEAKGQGEAFSRVVETVRNVFKVPAFSSNGDRHGLTAQECIELLTHFFGFLNELKKKEVFFPVTSRPKEKLADPLPTPNSSESSSTNHGKEEMPSTPKPLPSQSGSE